MQLNSLTNEELIDRLESLVRNEKATTRGIVKHLAEVNRRQLFLELGYSSLFDYATRGLGYSRSAAMRRIRVARAGTTLPKVFECLESGEVSLSTVEICSTLLEGKDGEAVLESLRGKSIEQAERIAVGSSAFTPWDLRDKVQMVILNLPPKDTATELYSEEPEGESYSRSGTNYETDREIGYRITFTVPEKFMALLREARELTCTGEAEDSKLERIFTTALEELVERRSPKRRLERRGAREKRNLVEKKQVRTLEAATAATQNSSSPNQEVVDSFQVIERSQIVMPEIKSLQPQRKLDTNSRRIPSWLRDEVLERDGYQCTFISKHGVRCQCRGDLELDHIQPYGRGGPTTKENLRVLCSCHNLHLARRFYGEGFIERKISQRQ